MSLFELRIIRLGFVSLFFMSLMACNGGGSNQDTPSGPMSGSMNDTTPPTVSFSPATLSIAAGETATSTLLTSDNIAVTTGPTVSCTNGGLYDIASNTFTAPLVATATTSVCTATASDAAGNQGSALLTVTVAPLPMTASCPRTLPAVTADTCDISTSTGDAMLLRGDVVYASGLTTDAEILIDNENIICTGCDCSNEPEFATATVVTCTDSVISPGLINGRESITFSFNTPFNNTERYQQRHDWRVGRRGSTQLTPPFSGSGLQVAWGEIRSVMGGVTSTIGGGSEPGMIRNLDRDNFVAALLPADIPPGGFVVELGANGINKSGTEIDTFPLGDIDGTQLTNNCAYDSFPQESEFLRNPIFASELDLDFFGQMLQLVIPADTVLGPTPFVIHVAEGIDAVARNEFLCLSDQGGGVDFLGTSTVMVSGAGLTANDIRATVADGSGLMWTPRADTSLYGNTAMIPVFNDASGMVGLGTNFISSGSAHVGRELACAADWNQRWGGNVFSEQEIINLATLNNAALSGYSNFIGEIATGKLADITVWRTGSRNGLNSIINAENEDVALVLRGGVPLYGDDNIIQALAASDNCEQINVCGESRRLCTNREFGMTLTDIMAAAPVGASDLFVCGNAWPNEPTCIPSRTSPDAYTGISTSGDTDGDGINDNVDNCIGVFNPPTPLDTGVQADSDNDGLGDLCDF